MIDTVRIAISDPGPGIQVASLDIKNGVATIGRSSKCDLVIPSNYSAVSGVHITVKAVGQNIEIIDGDSRKSSTNGVFVNGQRIPIETWIQIHLTDNISLGLPGGEGSVALRLEKTIINPNSQVGTSSANAAIASTLYNQGATPHNSSLSPSPASVGMYTQTRPTNQISESMRLRLERIEAFLRNGYSLEKDLGAFPSFVSQDNRRTGITLLNNPAGFSWIGFWFPFAVCTQIREWSYFYVIAASNFIFSIISALIKYDITGGVDIAISIMYGIYFPYLRYMALSKSKVEISKGWAILLGLFLSLLAISPSLIISSMFGPA